MMRRSGQKMRFRFKAGLVWASLLIACTASSVPWWQGVPVRLSIDVSPTIDASTVRAAVSDRLWQFGFVLADDGARELTVSYDAACECPDCQLPAGGSRAGILAYTPATDFSHIRLCPGLVATQRTDPLATYVVTSHEMCHALGLATHIAAGPSVLCSADYQAHKQVISFGDDDLRAICQAQGVKSAKCRASP